jgi:AAA+ ATPase superfamily predicted ATPase
MIGRKKEYAELQQIVESNQAEFIAVFGRRRVGKTFLIREFFNNKFTFYHTGIANENTKTQLHSFNTSLNKYGQTPYFLILNLLLWIRIRRRLCRNQIAN